MTRCARVSMETAPCIEGVPQISYQNIRSFQSEFIRLIFDNCSHDANFKPVVSVELKLDDEQFESCVRRNFISLSKISRSLFCSSLFSETLALSLSIMHLCFTRPGLNVAFFGLWQSSSDMLAKSAELLCKFLNIASK